MARAARRPLTSIAPPPGELFSEISHGRRHLVRGVGQRKLDSGARCEVLDILRVCATREQYGGAAMLLLTPPDPNLTLTRTQYPAIACNRENIEPFTYAGFAIPCNTQQPLTAHS